MTTIIEFEPKLKGAFKNLNEEWLNKYFVLEPHDHEQLNAPEDILKNGGKIFFAQSDGKTVGTATLIKTGDNEFELAKMAVTESYKGKGIGKLLMEHCMVEAKKSGAERVVLLSNSKLTTAIEMYKKFGFKEVPLKESPYVRVDIEMEKVL